MQIYCDLERVKEQPELESKLSSIGFHLEDICLIEAEGNSVLTPSIFLSLGADASNLERLKLHPGLQMLVPLRIESLDEDLEFCRAFLRDSHEPKASLISSQLTQSAESFKHQLGHSAERWSLIEKVGDYARSKLGFESLPDLVRMITSELLTNAIYNAPKNSAGRAVETDRTAVVEFSLLETIEFSYGECGDYIWIETKDPFGTFTREELLDHLLRCSKEKLVNVRMGPGGAGIGLFMVYQMASQLMFFFEPGKSTRVLVKLLKTRRAKDFESQRVMLEIIQK